MSNWKANLNKYWSPHHTTSHFLTSVLEAKTGKQQQNTLPTFGNSKNILLKVSPKIIMEIQKFLHQYNENA